MSNDPQELSKLNEQGLRELAVPEPDAKRLLGNPWFTPTYQTRFVAALRAVKVAGAADYVTTAGEAGNAREACSSWRARRYCSTSTRAHQ